MQPILVKFLQTMSLFLTVLLFASAECRDPAATLPTIRSAEGLASAVFDFYQPGRMFDITGTCSRADCGAVYFLDGSGAMRVELLQRDSPPAMPGDILRMRGSLVRGRTTPDRIHPICDEVEVVGRAQPPARVAATGPQLTSGMLDFRPIYVVGSVVDVFADEIDPASTYLLLDCQGERLHSPIGHADALAKDPNRLVGATVRVDGICIAAPYVGRKKIGRLVSMEKLTVLEASPGDPFAVPRLDAGLRIQPETLSRLGRRRLTGVVLACWDGCRVLLRADNMELVNVEMQTGELPVPGDRIDVAGLPETDLYTLSLARSCWRRSAGGEAAREEEPPPVDVPIRALFVGADSSRRLSATHNGRRIRVRGIVRSLPDENVVRRRLYIESDGMTFPIDVSTLGSLPPDVSIGSEIGAAGVCIMETEMWRPNATLQNIRGFLLSVNRAEDISVLSRPPWWTPARLLAVIAVLVLGLLGVLAWNMSLVRLAERRGRELFRAQIDKIGSQLRSAERARLAVELHDTLSQTLTGISMEVEAAIRSRTDGLDRVMTHVDVADKALKSCRTELKNSLWDLRSEALEMPDLKDAILRTLLPHVKGVDIEVETEIPRTRLSENTTHDILCIIRELSVNAIRHGRATRLGITGGISGGRLSFSVQDDGTGFDPGSCPGVEEGHFGLEGIRERLGRLGGSLAFSRTPEGGMCAEITIDAAAIAKNHRPK